MLCRAIANREGGVLNSSKGIANFQESKNFRVRNWRKRTISENALHRKN